MGQLLEKYLYWSVDCTAKTHTIKVNLFERAGYLHKGNQKKNQLVEKNILFGR